jgi:hypothetical protein
VEPKLFHADRRTDKHDEANCCFAQFLNALEDDRERRFHKMEKSARIKLLKKEVYTRGQVNI